MKPTIIIITGLSGSGKTVALRALEDSGFFCIDNLPPQLIGPLASIEAEAGGIKKVAVSIDIREREFLGSVESTLLPLRGRYSIEIVFLEAEPDVLVRRFKETRRPHPLGSSDMAIEDAISAEVKLLGPLRDAADMIIDTSAYTPHQLRALTISLYAKAGAAEEMSVSLISFGYKFGIPHNIDLLFDVRFLPNPHFVPALKELKGTDAPVREFVLESPETGEFIERLSGLMDFLVPLYIKEGRAYLFIGIGCTGGRHRSPVIVEKIASLMKEKNLSIEVIHRDM
ncbi:MAG: RNase adapter RapZ [Thermodesulfovibrionales bacterium]|nr:RNase adapter RapZ [Thermodesulfovibrionales bacterium]